MKFKVGDIVIGIKNDPDCPELRIEGKIGEVVEILINRSFPYRVVFKKQVDFEFSEELKEAYWDTPTDSQIELYLTKLKLKKLLED